MFSVCNHGQVTNVSGFLCRWRRFPGTTVTRHLAVAWAALTPNQPVNHLTPRRPITRSIITGSMIAAGVSGSSSSLCCWLWFHCMCDSSIICFFSQPEHDWRKARREHQHLTPFNLYRTSCGSSTPQNFGFACGQVFFPLFQETFVIETHIHVCDCC